MFPRQEQSSSRTPVRRCLFGRPNPQRTKQWLNERIEEMREENESRMAKWGFDFEADTPCVSASSDFIYTAVPASSVSYCYCLKTFLNIHLKID